MTSAFGEKQELEMEGIKHLYHCLEKGYNSMPLDFPGTPFHKAMKVRRQNPDFKLFIYLYILMCSMYTVNAIIQNILYLKKMHQYFFYYKLSKLL